MQVESFEEGMRRETGVRRELDVAHVGRVLARRKAWIFAPALICLVVSFIAVNVVKPRYTAEAKILIENQENFMSRPERADAPPLPDDEAVQSQVQLVTSRDIGRQAIRTLGLQGDPEFDPVSAGIGPISRLLVLLGLQPDPLRASAEDRLLSAYYDRLNVYPVVKSRVLSVQFTSVDPDLAAKAANTVADAYIALQSDAKRDNARAAAASLASLIADLKVKVAAAETKAQEYRAQNGLLVGTNNTTLASQTLADMTTQLGQARTAEADAQAKSKVLRELIKTNRVADLPEVANNDLIRRISEQRVTLKAQLAQQAQTLLPGHPRMREMNAQLADLDAQLRMAGEKMARQLENDAHVAAGRVDNLTAALDASKKTATVAGADAVTLGGLEQQARLLKEQLDFDTQKYQEAMSRQTAVSTPADARVFSRAIAPELPTYPKKLPTIAILTFAGLIFSIGLVIARELLSGRAFVEDVATGTTAPRQVAAAPVAIAPVVAAPVEEAPVAGADLRKSFTPSVEPPVPGEDADLRALLAAIDSHESEAGAVRMLFTGADDGIAVMPAALHVARSLSREARTILVDCGTSPGALDHLVTLREDGTVDGLGDLLAGESSFAEVIHRDRATRLHLVPAGALRPSGPDEDGRDFAVLMDALAQTYDRIILAAPVPAPGEVLRGIDRVELAVLLLSERQTTAEIDACRGALYAAGAPVVYTLAAVEARPADALAA